jgi:hypothetical protein
MFSYIHILKRLIKEIPSSGNRLIKMFWDLKFDKFMFKYLWPIKKNLQLKYGKYHYQNILMCTKTNIYNKS